MSWEVQAIEALQALANPVLDFFFRIMTECGGDIFWLLAIFTCFALGRRRDALNISVLLLANFYITFSLKYAIRRPRPGPELQRILRKESPSMPSTHAAEASGNFGYVARRTRKRWATLACVVLTVLAGMSRIYFGVHWPTDVLAGFALGLLVLLVYVLGLEPRISSWVPRIWPRRRYLIPLPLIVGIALAFLTPAEWEAPPGTYIGGLVAGIFLGVLLAGEGEVLSPGRKGDLVLTAACVLIGFLGLAFSTLMSGALQFLASTITGLWASWVGPGAIRGLRRRFLVSTGQ